MVNTDGFYRRLSAAVTNLWLSFLLGSVSLYRTGLAHLVKGNILVFPSTFGPFSPFLLVSISLGSHTLQASLGIDLGISPMPMPWLSSLHLWDGLEQWGLSRWLALWPPLHLRPWRGVVISKPAYQEPPEAFAKLSVPRPTLHAALCPLLSCPWTLSHRLRWRLVNGIFIKIILIQLSVWLFGWLGTTRGAQNLIVQIRYSEPSNDDELAQGRTGRRASERQKTVSSYFCVVNAEVAEMTRKLNGVIYPGHTLVFRFLLSESLRVVSLWQRSIGWVGDLCTHPAQDQTQI